MIACQICKEKLDEQLPKNVLVKLSPKVTFLRLENILQSTSIRVIYSHILLYFSRDHLHCPWKATAMPSTVKPTVLPPWSNALAPANLLTFEHHSMVSPCPPLLKKQRSALPCVRNDQFLSNVVILSIFLKKHPPPADAHGAVLSCHPSLTEGGIIGDATVGGGGGTAGHSPNNNHDNILSPSTTIMP